MYPYILCFVYRDNTDQRNAQFYKLMFNFLCLLHVSNLLGSSSGRQMYLLYDMCYVHLCEQSGGHTDTCNTYSTAYTAVSLR